MNKSMFARLAVIFWSLVIAAQAIITIEVYTDWSYSTGDRIVMWVLYMITWLGGGFASYTWGREMKDD